MSDLLQAVKSAFYQDVLGYSDAESRLEGSYLLSQEYLPYHKSRKVQSSITWSPGVMRQSLEQAVEIASVIVSSSADSFKFPVPPSSESSSGFESDGTGQHLGTENV